MNAPNPSFYTVGGPVQAGNGVYVPRRADGELLALCREGTFAYVLTARQMGKSSLMVRTAQQLGEEGIVAAIVDLQGSGKQVSVDQWYLNFLVSLEEALEEQDVELDTNVRKWWQQNTDLGPSKRFSLFMEKVLLEEVDGPIVVFVDEIDTTLGLDFTDDFFVAIRYFFTSRATKPVFERLSFVLIGVATPGDLIRDRQRTPFNVGRRVEVTDFTLGEAQPLAAGLGLPALKADQVMEWVLDWTGGHPYLTQQLCRALTEKMTDGSLMQNASWTEVSVADVVADTFFGEMRERDNNLQFVQGMLLDPRQDTYEVLGTYRQVWDGRQRVRDEEQSLVKSHLKLSGIVRREKNKALQVRNRIYQRVFDRGWVKENLPVNWRRQIRQLRGVIAVSFLLVGVLSGLTSWALWERAKAENQQQAALARQLVAQADSARRSQGSLLPTSILLASEANQRLMKRTAQIPRGEADGILRNYTLLASKRSQLEHDDYVTQVNFDPEGQYVVTLSADKAVRVWDSQDGSKVSELGFRNNITPVKLSSDGRLLAAVVDYSALKVLDVKNKAEISELRHGSAIKSVVFSPNSHLVVTATEDNEVWIWDSKNGAAIASLKHERAVKSIVFSPDSRFIATVTGNTETGNNDNKITIWNSRTGATITQLEHDTSVWKTSFSQDGAYMLASSGKSVIVWNAKTGKQINQLEHGGYIDTANFSPNGRYVAIAGWENVARIWDIQTGELALILDHDNFLNSVVFSPDGRYIVTASEDTTAKVWDVQGKEIARMNHSDDVTSIKISSDGRYIATVATNAETKDVETTVNVWSSDSDMEIARLKHDGSVRAVKFSPNSRYVATASADTTARVWNSENGEQIAALQHNSAVNSLSFSSDGRYMATSSADDTAKIWDGRDGIEIAQLQHDYVVNGVSFSPNGRYVATASWDDTARVWDRETGTEITRINHLGSVLSVSFSPDSRYVASTGIDTTAKVLELGKETGIILVHDGFVEAVSFSPNSRYVATASKDSTARIWDRQSGMQLVQLNHDADVVAVAFSPDGQYVATASSDDTARVWDSRSGTEVAQFNHDADVVAVAFSPDGQYVATASSDDTARVWDSRSGIEMARLRHADSVTSVSFSPNGRHIATASDDGTAEIRYVFTEDVLAQACDRLTRNLTLREWRRYLGEDEPYRKTCPKLPYPPDYEEAQENNRAPNNNLSSLSTWLTAKVNTLISLAQ